MSHEGSPGLIRAMGRWTLTALIINSIIGSGIFGLPSIVAGYLGRQSPFAYLIAAAGMGVVIASFAEVASRFRETGGPYLYAREAFGRFVGTEVGYLLLALKTIAAAAAADLFADYLVEFWPAAREPFPRRAVLTLLIGFVAAVNIRGIKSGAAANNIFTLAKLVPLALFVVSGCVFLLFRHSAIPATVNDGGRAPASSWFDAVLILTYAYAGFEAALVPMAEAREPQRDAPFGLFAALATVTVVYSSIQYVVVSVLPNAAASDRPLAAAARQFAGTPGALVISLGALIGVYGYLTAMLLHSPRVIFALGENGDLPRFLARVHPRYRTPHISILAFAGIVWCLAAAGSFRWNVLLSSVTRLLVMGFTCATLPILRRMHPDTRGYRAPAGNLIALVGVLFVVVLASRMTGAEIVICVLALLIAAVNRRRVRESAA